MPFTQDTLDFLFENQLQDSREWFRAHHDRYEQSVLLPFKELVQVLTPVMLEIDECILTDPRRVISRINRDIRFSHDKSLYRNRMWIAFSRDKHAYDAVPAFYFELTLHGF